MKKLLFLCLPLIGSMAFAQSKEDLTKFGALITQQGLKEKLTVIASAEMEGRETATPGQKKAAAYIEAQFKKMGLKPGNGDSYQQVYPVYQDALTNQKLKVNGKSFVWDKDYSFSLQSIASGDWGYNNTVFAGYGIVDSANKINDYANLDVKGKIVLVLEGSATATATPAAGGRGMNTNPASSVAKMRAAIAKGAAGLLVISADFPRKNPTPVKGNMYLNKNNAAGFLMATVSTEVASALVGRTSTLSVADFKNLKKGNYVAELNIAATKTTENLESSNVVALLPGTDKKDEYLFVTGHYDHLGKRGDVIYYGADDDGSGTVSVMQMAEAYAAAAKKGKGPRRSIVFMTVSGEEKVFGVLNIILSTPFTLLKKPLLI